VDDFFILRKEIERFARFELDGARHDLLHAFVIGHTGGGDETRALGTADVKNEVFVSGLRDAGAEIELELLDA